ncbi:Uncharacterised protein [Escherichia coli]|uniref:Uncharacterized protein n=1 Tax=Escherichia coli TaxID=562 RepID=A0A377D8L9_ECOLX|nr:Uncharacterised protein [Escherichia coli]
MPWKRISRKLSPLKPPGPDRRLNLPQWCRAGSCFQASCARRLSVFLRPLKALDGFSLISRHLADNGASTRSSLKNSSAASVSMPPNSAITSQKCLLNVFRHAISVAADINVGTVIDPAPQLRALFAQFVLYVNFFFLIARPGKIDTRQHAPL